MKLDIGAGNVRHGEGWTTVDLHTEADIKASMDKLPMDANSVEEIWSSHALEHQDDQKILATLKEWERVLKPGGKMTLQVPNLDYIARYWLHGGDRSYAKQIIFGNQQHAGEYHKTGWNPAMLRADLEAAGFRVDKIEIVWDYAQETIRAEAVKVPR